jgi:hypothetical protein
LYAAALRPVGTVLALESEPQRRDRKSEVVVALEPAHREEAPRGRQVERRDPVESTVASAASDDIPADVRPAVRPNSTTPMPPGTGMKLERSETLTLMRRTVESGM